MDFQVVAYSRRYHPPSPPIPEGVDYAFEEHYADLAALSEALAPEGAHLVGHSYGALLAMVLAARHPDLVRSLVLMEPPALGLWVSDPPRPAELLRLLFRDPVLALTFVRFGMTTFAPAKAALRRGDTEAAIRAVGQGVLGREAFARMSADKMVQVRENFIPAELLGSGLPSIPADLPQAVGCPVLLMTGERSPPIFRRIAERLAKRLPRTERVQIPGSSHAMHWDAPETVTEVVQRFLKRHFVH